MNYSINQKVVAEKAIIDTLEFIDIRDYEGLSTKKEVLENMLKSVEHKDNKGNIQLLVRELVFGGCFRIYNDEILEFLKTLDINDNMMKWAEKEPMTVYANVLWHAIKRYLKDN